MEKKGKRPIERPGPWFVTVRVELQGAEAPAAQGSSRRLSRCPSVAELTALHERLRTAAEEYLRESGALGADAGEGWADLRSDGSWAWRITRRDR